LPTVSSRLYVLAGRALSPLLSLPFVENIYIRRSVAAGEAEFPWSDLDLGVVVRQASGKDLHSLHRRFRVASVLFPRLGECQIATAEELAEMAEMDPFRASLDRRYAISVLGGAPPIPAVRISSLAAARRLVFWFEHYLPLSVRQGNVRNQRKFAKEMANALGVVEGRWVEPWRSRAETTLPADLPQAPPFVQCCLMAERAQRLLRPEAPVLKEVVLLPSLVLLPEARTPVPVALPEGTIVATPAVLDLLLSTQSPFLWLQHGKDLKRLGFSPPPLDAWIEACYRQTSGERLRLPGFSEPGPITQEVRLARTAAILDAVESGHAPESAEGPEVAACPSVGSYYLEHFDRLARSTSSLHQRARALRSGRLGRLGL
jgi:hypothetical protein